MKSAPVSTLVAATVAVVAIGLGNALVDLITLAGVGAIGYCIVRYYRNKVAERDDLVKDREAKIRLLEHDLDLAEGSKSKAEAEMARYRAQLGRQDTSVLPMMGRINGNNT